MKLAGKFTDDEIIALSRKETEAKIASVIFAAAPRQSFAKQRKGKRGTKLEISRRKQKKQKQ
jgi:hypothetical protein